MASRNGQAALEFMATYGWAILAVMVAIGALAYFGVMNPSKLIPERCGGSPEFICADYRINATSTAIILKQTIGKTIYLMNASCSYQKESPKQATAVYRENGVAYTYGSSWSPREKISVICKNADLNVPAGLVGEKAKIDYFIEYNTSTTGLTHSAEGEVIAEVQE